MVALLPAFDPASVQPLPGNMEAVLRFCDAGVPTFPCDDRPDPKKPGSPSKRPLVHGNWKVAATADFGSILSMFEGRPFALVGLPSGPSSLLVIDCDRRPGKPDGVKAFGELIDAHGLPEGVVIVETQSGGLHYYFRQPADFTFGNSTGALPAGVDVRGDGGYTIAPGSILADGRGWREVDGCPKLIDALANGALPVAPTWLVDMLRGPKKAVESIEDAGAANAAPKAETSLSERARASAPASVVTVGEYGDEAEVEWRFIEDALTFIPSDDRDTWLKVGAALHDKFGAAGRGLWDEWSMSSSKFDRADQEKTWASFSRPYSGSRAGIGTIIAMARSGNNGFTGRKSDYAVKQAIPEWMMNGQGILAGTAVEPVQESPTAQQANDVDEDDNDPYWEEGVEYAGEGPAEPVPTLVDELIPAEGLTFLGGQSGAGKSFLAIHLAVMCATGQEFFGRKVTERIGVIYVAAEGGATIRNRLVAAAIGAGVDDKLPMTTIRGPQDLLNKQERTRFKKKLARHKRKIATRFGVTVKLVIVDTLAAAFAIKDENSSSEMNTVCKAAAELGDSIGAATLALHHFGKDPSTGLRGASAIRGAGESVLSALADRDELSGTCRNRRLVHSKSRVGEEGPLFGYDLVDVPVGVTKANGQPLMVAYVSVDNAQAERVVTMPAGATKAPKLSVSEQAALKALRAIEGSAGRKARPFGGEGPEVTVVPAEAFRDEFYKAWPAEGDTPEKKKDARRNAFNRGVRGLIAKERIATREIGDGEEVYWLVDQGGRFANLKSGGKK